MCGGGGGGRGRKKSDIKQMEEEEEAVRDDDDDENDTRDLGTFQVKFHKGKTFQYFLSLEPETTIHSGSSHDIPVNWRRNMDMAGTVRVTYTRISALIESTSMDIDFRCNLFSSGFTMTTRQ